MSSYSVYEKIIKRFDNGIIVHALYEQLYSDDCIYIYFTDDIRKNYGSFDRYNNTWSSSIIIKFFCGKAENILPSFPHNSDYRDSSLYKLLEKYMNENFVPFVVKILEMYYEKNGGFDLKSSDINYLTRFFMSGLDDKEYFIEDNSNCYYKEFFTKEIQEECNEKIFKSYSEKFHDKIYKVVSCNRNYQFNADYNQVINRMSVKVARSFIYFFKVGEKFVKEGVDYFPKDRDIIPNNKILKGRIVIDFPDCDDDSNKITLIFNKKRKLIFNLNPKLYDGFNGFMLGRYKYRFLRDMESLIRSILHDSLLKKGIYDFDKIIDRIKNTIDITLEYYYNTYLLSFSLKDDLKEKVDLDINDRCESYLRMLKPRTILENYVSDILDMREREIEKFIDEKIIVNEKEGFYYG